MEQIYNVLWQGFEHRIIIDKSKVDVTKGPSDLNGFWGTNNLPIEVIITIFRNEQLEGLQYEVVTQNSLQGIAKKSEVVKWPKI